MIALFAGGLVGAVGALAYLLVAERRGVSWERQVVVLFAACAVLLLAALAVGATT